MTEKRKIPLQLREAEVCAFEMRAADSKGPARLTFSLSSEYPVERYFGTEILSHEPSAMRMDRLSRGAMPLLFNHNWDDPVGMVDGGTVRDGRLQVDAHLFDTERAREVAAMLDGGLRNVSLGYRIHDAEEDAKTGEVRVTSWEPYEASIVTVPADPTVGLGRSGQQEFEVSFRSNTANPAAHQGDTKVSNAENAAAGASAEVNVEVVRENQSAVQAEAGRTRVIENLAKANNIDTGIANRWISSGASLEQVSEDVMQILASRSSKTKSVADLGMSKNEQRKFSIARAIRACADQNWADAGLEAEASREIAKRLGVVADKTRFYVPADIQKRDLTVGTSSAGGFLVATENQSFIEILRNSAISYKAGVTNLSGLVGNVTIPRQTAAATNYWLSTEATAITESQQTFGQMSLSPKTAGAYTEISRQLLLQSSPGAEQIVMTDLAQQVGLAVDAAVLNGSGGSGQPQGIIGTAGIGSVTGTSIAYAGIVEFQTDTAAGNALYGASAYITTPAVAGLLKQRVKFTSTASPIWEGGLLEGRVDGYNAFASNQVPSANILFGDFSKVVLAEWGVLQVEVNPYANFAAGIVGVRAMYSIDVGVRYAAAFSLATSVT